MFDLISEFHFIRPWWLMLLAMVPITVFFQVRIAKRSNNWFNVISPDLFEALVERSTSKKQRVVHLLPAMFLLCASIGLAGPTYERIPQPVETKVDALVVILDLTLSMQSEDVEPTRVDRAKFKIADILNRRDEGLTALVVYAGDAYVVTPLTHDDSNISNLLPSLTPEMMPVRGSNVVAAVRQANELLSSLDTEDGMVLLVTDGIEDLTSLLRETNPKFPISVLGIGVSNAFDSPVRSTVLDENKLRDVARLAHGRYHIVTTNDDDLDHLLSTGPITSTDRLDEQQFDSWHDMGYYLIFPMALLLAISMRRGGLVVVLLVISTQVQAGWLEDLWLPKNKQAQYEFERGNYSEATQLFEDPSWQGTAAFRDGDFAKATESFSELGTIAAQYNKANALAWQGYLTEAIKTYDDVLEVEPQHEDALHNKAVLEQLLEQMQQENSDSDQSEGDEQQQSDSQQSESEESSSSEQQEGEQQQQQSQSGEQNQEENKEQSETQQSQTSEQEQDESKEEQQQAMQQQQASAEDEESAEEREIREIHERWLRRIPEDPGGLLRRKFQAESNARIQRGELDQRNTGSAW